MKIGFFGNVNNFPFTIARAMRRLGHDVLFVVDRGASQDWHRLYRPENRYPDIRSPYPNWICDVSPIDLWRIPPPTGQRQRVLRLLRTCDTAVLNDTGPLLGPHLGIPYCVLLTGSDLEFLANYRFFDRTNSHPVDPPFVGQVTSRFKGAYLRWMNRRLVSTQRRGIRNAIAVNYFPRGIVPRGDLLLDDIGVPDARRIHFMISDLELIRYAPPPTNPALRIFNVARLTWGRPPSDAYYSNLDMKGTDIMLAGIARFLRAAPMRVELRLVKKGRNVAETMDLTKRNGIEKNVTWLDEMTQAEVLVEYLHADIVLDQVGQSMVSMGTLDAMAMGRPVIANGRPEVMEKFIGEPSPICQASTSEEICSQLTRLGRNREDRERIGRESRAYIEKHFSADRAARICLERLEAAVQGRA